jgi:hypothetical protein
VQGLRWVLVAILAVDALQLAAAAVALVQGRRRRTQGQERLAAYSLRHAGLLASGSCVLAVPAVAGLLGAVRLGAAVWVALAAEVVALGVSRPALGRLHDRFVG